MVDATTTKITVSENGPYLVSGGLPLSVQAIGIDAAGNASSWEPRGELEVQESYALCRCGESASKPFCDGTHARVGFDGKEIASRRPFAVDAELLPGPTMDLADDQPLCAFARFCDGHGSIWANIERTDSEQARELVTHQGTHCPSGRLVVRDHEGGEVLEPHFEPSVVLVEDPQENVSGPIWVRGGVQVVAADGFAYEVRNRVTLCRCGQSSNKPFCDGTHASVGFRAGPT
jgi:CDGSH-type Zn-finger protein